MVETTGRPPEMASDININKSKVQSFPDSNFLTIFYHFACLNRKTFPQRSRFKQQKQDCKEEVGWTDGYKTSTGSFGFINVSLEILIFIRRMLEQGIRSGNIKIIYSNLEEA
ncbi:hypothetical protein GOODEAATRI_014127 [Goodea atripinnis]|uniref:Uncharacterized protein n=1 Tax=Goodea atripinnis TaxID=208336 RepID=A0ABV0MJM7_9TELE